MISLNDYEIDLVYGGTGTSPPVCKTTTSNGVTTTTCSCPAGSSLTIVQSAKKVEMTCVQKS
jgi:hypothetical protein